MFPASIYSHAFYLHASLTIFLHKPIVLFFLNISKLSVQFSAEIMCYFGKLLGICVHILQITLKFSGTQAYRPGPITCEYFIIGLILSLFAIEFEA
jgi:hypothetical protein